MALRKTDLYSSLWKGADELRGGMDASQYKDYVLTLLFVKYVTDKAKFDPRSLIEVPPGGSFDDLVDLKGDKEIGDKINKAVSRLAEANDLQNVINLADFNDEEKLGKGKEMQDRLSNLISIFQDLDFRGSRADGDDLLGDAYEYLMRHFATESGKSKGQFYTPAEVSRVMAKLIGITSDTPFSATVYDPTCGSGSLLLKVADEAPNGLTIYGQEKDNATWALAKMNMILHNNEIADIRKGDTITSPQFIQGDRLETFDFLVANPPFSVKSWASGLEDEYGRFDGYSRPPAKNGDFAFLLHMLKSLKSSGKGAVILPHGVLFRGNAEGAIRREILQRGYIKGIVGLPANLFYGTGIPACIIILDKEGSSDRSGIFMIEASRGFEKDGPKNRLRPRDMHKIVDVFSNHLEIPGYSRMVPISEIGNATNDFNLNIARYLDGTEKDDTQDLHAHIFGGIPDFDLDAMDEYWSALPALREKLFRQLRPGYSELKVSRPELFETVMASEQRLDFSRNLEELFEAWWRKHLHILESISSTTAPGYLIKTISEDLLAAFKPIPLVDEYAVYEHLMNFWTTVMQDDTWLIVTEGWEAASKPRRAIEDSDRKLSEVADLILGSGKQAQKYKMDLVPPQLVVNKFFSSEKAELNILLGQFEAASLALGEFIEENSGDEGLLQVAMEDGKITKALAKDRLREAKGEESNGEEVAALQELLGLYESESIKKKLAKESEARLSELTLAKYGELELGDLKKLVIEDKWGLTLKSVFRSEVDQLFLGLVARIGQLADRYGETLSSIEESVSSLSTRVMQHLADMGIR
jgi:type I restriction enzyme M protein